MNKIFAISGASGSGKTTIARKVMDNELLSFTTRPMREGEVDGRDYIFITENEFEHLLNNNGLAENTVYGGNYYGLTRSEIETKLKKGNCYVIVDNNGMKQLKQLYDNVISIYIYSSKEDCELNMRSRGDSEENIKQRLTTYEEEEKNSIEYDYVVINKRGEMGRTIEEIKAIVYGEER